MPKFFVAKEQIGKQITILAEDAKHIKTVLRAKQGEQMVVCDGEGTDYICKISHMVEKEILLDIVEKKECQTEPSTKITLFQGLPKADKMDMIIQKCVEVGIDKIIPVATERAIVKLEKKEYKKLQRWQKIAEAAAKQSGRGKIPKIENVLSFQDAIKESKKLCSAVIPYEKETKRGLKEFVKTFSGDTLGIFIGPEGGFSQEEIQQAQKEGILPITLGKRILRTETAGIVATAILLYELE